jgi:hypothetical protein
VHVCDKIISLNENGIEKYFSSASLDVHALCDVCCAWCGII